MNKDKQNLLNQIKAKLDSIFSYLLNIIWKFIYKTGNLFFKLLPWVMVGSIAIIIFKYAWISGLNFNEIIELLKVGLWPLTVFISIYFFRKVFVYLFFSLDSFNFFGLKGGLIPVEQMIIKKANEMFESNKKSYDREMEFNKLSKIIDIKSTNINQYKSALDKTKKLYEDLNSDFNKLVIENNQLRDLISKNQTIPDSSCVSVAQVDNVVLGDDKGIDTKTVDNSNI